MNNSDWRKIQKENWPERSLERVLARDFPGCSSAIEALKSVTALHSRPSRQSTKKEEPVISSSDFEAMQRVLREVKEIIGDYDIDLLPDKPKEYLKTLPLKTLEGAVKWKNTWIKIMEQVRRKNGLSK